MIKSGERESMLPKIRAARNRRFGRLWLFAMGVLLCFSAPVWAAELIVNGGFNGSTGWTLGGTGTPQYTESQSNTTPPGVGSGSFQEQVLGRNKTFTGTASQSVSMMAGAVINGATDITLSAMEQNNGFTTATSVTITLRYQDATTVEIFSGTVAAGSAWTSIVNATATVFPLTLAQSVNQVTVNVTSSTANNGSAQSDVFVDDVSVIYTPAATDSLTVTSSVNVSTTAQPGQTDVQMMYLQLNSDATGNGNCVVTGVTLNDAYITAAGTISGVQVHIDNNSNFLDGTLGFNTLTNWNGLSTLVDLSAIPAANRTVYAGTPKFIWILYNIDAASATGIQVQAHVTDIGVVAPDIAPISGPWDSNVVDINTGLGCSGCHPLPPLDGATRNPTTGAVVGNHETHGTTYAFDCTLCHLAIPPTARHRNKNVELAPSIGTVANARYDKNGDHAHDASWEQATVPVRGRCENTNCHGGINSATTYGGPSGTGPQWGSVSADTCTFCHNANKTNAGGVANAYPTAASPFRSANAAGAHAVHMTGSSGLINGGVACADCHTVPVAIGDAGHIGELVDPPYTEAPADVPFPAGSDARLNSYAAAYTSGAMTCNVYCHGIAMPKGDTSGTNEANTSWTANWANYPTGCTAACHGLPPTAGTSASQHSGQAFPGSCMGCHGDTVTSTTNPPTINTTFHINGIVEASGCTGCHGTDPKQYPPVSFWGANKSTADGVGAHVAHIEATATYMTKEAVAGESDTTGYWCAECHTTTRGAGSHNDGYPAEIAFTNAVEAKYNATAASRTVEADNNPDLGNGATCSVYCHGANMPKGDTSGTNRTPAWGLSLSGCAICHGAPPTAGTSAVTHSGQGFPASCIGCHGSTVLDTNNPPTLDPAFHINGIVEATGCTGCHGGGSTGSVSGFKNIWPDNSTAHAANQSGRHVKHVTAIAARIWGYADLNTLLNNDDASFTRQKQVCEYCHQAVTNDGDHMSATDADVFPAGYAKMLDGTADTATVASYTAASDTCSNVDCHNNKLTTAGTYDWYSAGTSTCMMCHSIGGTNNPTSGLHAAGLTTTNSVTGENHDDSFGAGGTCTSCHNMTGKVNAATGTHINKAFTGNGSIGSNFTAMGLNAGVYTASADNTGTCQNTSCHLGNSDDWAHVWSTVANYYTTAATACEGCHGDKDNGVANAGVLHRTGGVSTHSGGATYGCKDCHVLEASTNNYTFTFGSTDWFPLNATSEHGNSTIEINTNGTYSTTFNTCDACHSDDHGDGIHNYVDTGWAVANLGGDGISGGSCLGCHGATVNASLGAITTDQAFPNGGSHAGNFGMTTKHITGALADAQCEVCHDTANQPMNIGSANRDKIQLKNADTGATIVIDQSLAETNATRNLNTVTFCTSCHDANGATSTFRTGYSATNPFGSGVTVKDIGSLYNSTVTGKTHNYSFNNTPQLVKARSPHGKPTTNVMKNETARTNFAADTAPVGCQSCHPSHGGTNTNPIPSISGGTDINSTVVNASMMLSGYSEPGNCWTCHNAAGVKDYYGDSTVAGNNWTGVQKSSFAYKNRNYLSRHQVQLTSFTPTRANARTSADSTASVSCSVCHNPHGATTWVGTSGAVAYQSFSLRGNWMTSPYLEDRAAQTSATTSGLYAGKPLGPRTSSEAAYNRPAILGHGYSAAGGSGWDGYYLDENTFGPPAKGYPTATIATTMTETATSFAGLCANCHAASVGASSGGSVAAMQGYLNNASSTGVTDWSATAKVHNTVKGWYAAGNSVDRVNFTNNPTMRLLQSTYGSGVRVIQVSTSYSPRTEYAWGVNLTVGTKQAYHNFSCSKCHTPHASSLPRLMVSNCLDVGTGTTIRAAKNATYNNAVNPQRYAYTYPTYSTGWGSGSATGSDTAQHCHNFKKTNTAGGGGWNQLTGW